LRGVEMANLVYFQPLLIGGEGFVVPTPSTYIGNTATVVDSARNVSGKMIGTVIRNGVAKIQMSWNFISAQDWAAMLKQFEPSYGGSFTRRVTFFNQTSGTLETRQMYVGDRTSSGSFLLYNTENAPDESWIGLPRGYLGAQFSLIEV
jgi:hypothetical protein